MRVSEPTVTSVNIIFCYGPSKDGFCFSSDIPGTIYVSQGSHVPHVQVERGGAPYFWVNEVTFTFLCLWTCVRLFHELCIVGYILAPARHGKLASCFGGFRPLGVVTELHGSVFHLLIFFLPQVCNKQCPDRPFVFVSILSTTWHFLVDLARFSSQYASRNSGTTGNQVRK